LQAAGTELRIADGVSSARFLELQRGSARRAGVEVPIDAGERLVADRRATVASPTQVALSGTVDAYVERSRTVIGAACGNVAVAGRLTRYADPLFAGTALKITKLLTVSRTGGLELEARPVFDAGVGVFILAKEVSAANARKALSLPTELAGIGAVVLGDEGRAIVTAALDRFSVAGACAGVTCSGYACR
jgi:hypothetical protein